MHSDFFSKASATLYQNRAGEKRISHCYLGRLEKFSEIFIHQDNRKIWQTVIGLSTERNFLSANDSFFFFQCKQKGQAGDQSTLTKIKLAYEIGQ